MGTRASLPSPPALDDRQWNSQHCQGQQDDDHGQSDPSHQDLAHSVPLLVHHTVQFDGGSTKIMCIPIE